MGQSKIAYFIGNIGSSSRESIYFVIDSRAIQTNERRTTTMRTTTNQLTDTQNEKSLLSEELIFFRSNLDLIFTVPHEKANAFDFRQSHKGKLDE